MLGSPRGAFSFWDLCRKCDKKFLKKVLDKTESRWYNFLPINGLFVIKFHVSRDARVRQRRNIFRFKIRFKIRFKTNFEFEFIFRFNFKIRFKIIFSEKAKRRQFKITLFLSHAMQYKSKPSFGIVGSVWRKNFLKNLGKNS